MTRYHLVNQQFSFFLPFLPALPVKTTPGRQEGREERITKRYLLIITCIICLMSIASQTGAQQATGTGSSFSGAMLFDNDWRFKRGGVQGAEAESFDDSSWRLLDLPHDWSIEDLPGTGSPFNPAAISQVNGGFTEGGTGWYRKTFTIDQSQKGKRFFIRFDGVYMNAEVWINGQSLGDHPYGYTSFAFDLTPHIRTGAKNTIVVKVKNEGENSRWYSGSGIYRHVWLSILNPVHIQQWGTYITTPAVNAAAATVAISTHLTNSDSIAHTVTLQTVIKDANGKEIGSMSSQKTLSKDIKDEIEQKITVPSPALWSIETPVLYTLQTKIYQQDNNGSEAVLLDEQQTPFGIRTLSFDTTGFRLNGKLIKLKGGCIHHDNGPLGAKAYDRAEERKIELLKASGYNAIRCAHNPPSPALLAACDRLGMLVIDEAFDMWRIGKNPADYHLYFDEWWQRDIESMVMRDRNHPSVIMWSIGNEIPERGTAAGAKTASLLANHIRQMDNTRPVTAAVNGLNPDKDPFFATLEIAGYNYAAGGDHWQQDVYAQDHQRVPGRIMYESESYPLDAFDSWMKVLDHPYVLGGFVWTAFDYIGEASIGWLGYFQKSNFYPWTLAFCGDMDICGWKRPQSYYRDALWKENQLSVFVKPPVPSFTQNPDREAWSKWHWADAVDEWNWKGHENEPMDVTVYSSCDQVELFLNGRSLGKKKTGRSTEFMATWKVPYAAGELKATGFKGKKVIQSAVLKTAGTASRLRLSADRVQLLADNQDLSYITVECLDDNGNRDPNATPLLKFSITGDARIIGVGNADPMSTESYQQPQRKAWKGRTLVIVKAGKQPGAVTLTASGEGVKDASISIEVK